LALRGPGGIEAASCVLSTDFLQA